MKRFWIFDFGFWIGGLICAALIGAAPLYGRPSVAARLYGRPSVAAPQPPGVSQPLEESSFAIPSGKSASWREAEAGYQYNFPRDHASHDDYGTEWWYYTGNLQTDKGRRFGYQLTFFRVGVDQHPVNPSRWAVRNLYVAHFAISDIDRETFHSFERINRSAVGWAGAASSGYRVWNQDWEARLDGNAHVLTASEEDCELSLRLDPEKPETIHGLNKVSQKGAGAGNASQYYSLTRLQTSGHLTVAGEVFEVSGLSWMDHEFGTSMLEAAQTGWDWFSIQLEDGRDLMLFQIRRSDGSIDSHSSGTIVDGDGRVTHITRDDLILTPGNRWHSDASGADYPIAWTISIPNQRLSLTVSAAFAEQELRATESMGVIYWEGSIAIKGSSADQPIKGRGYLEMTGYAGASMSVLMR